jgi:ribosomal protein S19
MIRSKWKLFYNFKDLKKSKFFVKKRSMPIIFLKNQVFYVYNGKYFFPIKWSEQIINYKLGEFVFTKKKCRRVYKKKK